MKKKAFLIFVVIVALVFSGCTSSSTPEPVKDLPPTAKTEPTEAPPEPTEVSPELTPTEEPAPTPAGPLILSSDSFENEGIIPVRYGMPPFSVPYHDGTFECRGSEDGKENISPALAWTNVPLEAESLVLIMVDFMHYSIESMPEDALFPHWLVYNIPPDEEGFAEAKSGELVLPEGAVEGNNNFPEDFTKGYGGPCPPMGKEHLYIFTLYALDTVLDVESGIRNNALREAMEGHIIAEAEWRGYYTNQ